MPIAIGIGISPSFSQNNPATMPTSDDILCQAIGAKVYVTGNYDGEPIVVEPYAVYKEDEADDFFLLDGVVIPTGYRPNGRPIRSTFEVSLFSGLLLSEAAFIPHSSLQRRIERLRNIKCAVEFV
ncbi:hypothetical protein [Rhizobium sp. LjRoot254]|uniref:hypothetical protein n=1 Tax=Rhizobium sp. LjRoot254 TaxID=3342297 RepID=UPI003ECC391C